MITSQSLVLFAVWAGNDNVSTRNWLTWYVNHLNECYSECPKIVVFNSDTHLVAEEVVSKLANVAHLMRVKDDFNIGSDASSYQAALYIARNLDLQPDAVLFLHSKAISHEYEDHGLLRDYLSQTTLNRDLVGRSLSDGAGLITSSGYLLQGPGGIAEARRFAEARGCPAPLAIGAGTSIYWWSGDIYSKALERLEPAFFATPLAEQGFNRFFFESVAPSFAISLGADPCFVGGAQSRSDLNAYCSYHEEPQHNSALVMREWRGWREKREGFFQHPVPYVFGPASRTQIAFEF